MPTACVSLQTTKPCCGFLQTCHAYAAEGGRVVVVMTQREKIAMEALFRRTIPPHKRDGCQFVFRQARAAPPERPSEYLTFYNLNLLQP